MAKQLTDDEASLKRKARRRLIGAVALTTAIVVLLPMLLDSEPRQVGQDIELRIPDKDKVGEFAPKIGLPPASAPAAALPAPVTAPVIAATSALQAAPKTPESKPASSAPDTTAPEQAQAKPAEQAQVVPQQNFVVQIGAFTKAETAHRWKENLSKQGIKVYTEKSGNKTRVRAGPYTTREAADKVLHKLEAQGLHPDVSPAE